MHEIEHNNKEKHKFHWQYAENCKRNEVYYTLHPRTTFKSTHGQEITKLDRQVTLRPMARLRALIPREVKNPATQITIGMMALKVYRTTRKAVSKYVALIFDFWKIQEEHKEQTVTNILQRECKNQNTSVSNCHQQIIHRTQ